VPRRLPRSAGAPLGAIAVAVLAAALGALGGSGRAVAAGCAATDPPAAASAPSPAAACLVEVDPYPFGDAGEAVDAGSVRCRLPNLPCHLEVTSLAFRAWNRGLAATRRFEGGSTPFGVWLWNGSSWSPDPTFPGSSTCPGGKVLWAGKLDYWLVGAGNWGRLCRFDGANFQWQPLSLPTASLDRVTVGTTPSGQPIRSPGGITSGACHAWNDCWFFGTHGTVLRWDGATLSDASPDAGSPWRWTGFADAVAKRDAAGNPVGFAVGLSARSPFRPDEAVPAQPDGSPPPQLLGSDGGPFAPVPFVPDGVPVPGDPFRTDLVAVDADAAGRAWTAGVPRIRSLSPQPAPIGITTRFGPDPACPGPGAGRFPGSGPGLNYIWRSLSTVPGTDSALVGGSVFSPGPPPDPEQPILVRMMCAGLVEETRFLVPDPEDPARGLVPRRGGIAAVTATASNDAWAALPRFETVLASSEKVSTPPVLLRLQDGRPPQAPAGDDLEDRPIVLTDDSPVPAGVPSPEVVVRPKLPKFFAFRSRFKGRTLTLTFRVRRPGLLGLQALRKKRVVATTGLRRFRPPRGTLKLKFNPKKWPTRIELLTETPVAVMVNPPRVLRGSVRLAARARAIRGRRIDTVRFDYAPARSGDWREIATAFGTPPYLASFLTTQLDDGAYDFRVVVTDTAGEEGVSAVVRRTVTNGNTP
jgi:hypothetical protein